MEVAVRFIQVKTSEGVKPKNGIRDYSFHANLKSNVDDRAFYAWIALAEKKGGFEPHFYIFNHKEINKFDDTSLDSYQKTDNQKITLHIDGEGKVTNRGRIRDFKCFDEFYDNFEKLYMGVEMVEVAKQNVSSGSLDNYEESVLKYFKK